MYARRGHDLGIGTGVFSARHLYAELVEFAQSARLRFLVAEAGENVENLLRKSLV